MNDLMCFYFVFIDIAEYLQVFIFYFTLNVPKTKF
jgi:hypothetical protein